jgi:hypothetical protein
MLCDFLASERSGKQHRNKEHSGAKSKKLHSCIHWDLASQAHSFHQQSDVGGE